MSQIQGQGPAAPALEVSPLDWQLLEGVEMCLPENCELQLLELLYLVRQ